MLKTPKKTHPCFPGAEVRRHALPVRVGPTCLQGRLLPRGLRAGPVERLVVVRGHLRPQHAHPHALPAAGRVRGGAVPGPPGGGGQGVRAVQQRGLQGQ